MISLCMIVKNEEKYIAECLENAQEVVDEIIVVDTGSTDHTLDILSELPSVRVEHFDWTGDFSEARNYSLQFATQKWVMVLDADEMLRVDKESFFNELNSIDQKAINIPIFNLHDNTMPTLSAVMPRLFLRSGASYINKIHEQLTYNNEVQEGFKISEEIIHIVHYGYLKETIQEKDKSKRNIELLKEDIQRDPGNAFNHYNLGVSYMSIGEYKKALDCFFEWSRHEKEETPTYYISVIINVAICLYEMRNYGELERHLLDYKDDIFVKNNPEYHLRLGQLYQVIGKTDLALESYLEAIRLGERLSDVITLGAGSFTPKFLLAKMRMKDKKIEAGLLYYLDGILCINNRGFVGIIEIKEILSNKKRKRLLEYLTSEEFDDIENKRRTHHVDRKEISELKNEFYMNLENLLNMGHLEEAKRLITEYEKVIGYSADLYSYKGIIELMENNYLLAFVFFAIGYRNNQDNFDLLYNMAYISELLDEAGLAKVYYEQAYNIGDIIERESAQERLNLLNEAASN